MGLIKVELAESVITFRGDLSLLNRQKTKHWLKKNYEILVWESNEISISDDKFKFEKYLYDFQSTLIERIPETALEFGEAFEEKIQEELQHQENFEIFSQQALNIWTNNYETEELQEFCNVIGENMPKRRLYKLQAKSAFHMAFSQNSCNFSVPGAGKTSIVYGAYSYLKHLPESNEKRVNKLLIIGPPSSFQPWETEYTECFGLNPSSIRLSGETPVHIKKDVLKGITNVEYELYLVTYQSIPYLFEELDHFLTSTRNRVMMVCDEAHKFKSLTGIWSSTILKLAPKAVSRVVLTGTPAPNGYEDLYNLFKFIYPERNVIGFKWSYLRHLTENPIQSQINDLIEVIKPYFVRIKKTDLNLPNYTDHPIILNNLSKLEGEIYKRLETSLASESDDINKQSIHFRLIQSSSNLRLLTKPISEFEMGDFEKYDFAINLEKILGEDLFTRISNLDENYIPSKHLEVKKLLTELKKRGQKVIIWGYYIDSIKSLNKFLQSQGFNGSYIIGETKKATSKVDESYDSREGILEKFKIGDSDYLISNPVVLGESISLHKVCHNAIYFEQWYAAAPYVQSRDRIHRVWLDSNLNQVTYETNYYHIISNTRADKGIHNRVQSKFKRMMELIEHEIPFFNEDIEGERNLLIEQIINGYRLREDEAITAQSE